MSDNKQEPNIKFAYWVPNVSGGLVVSKIEQRTDWGIDYNRKLAVLAENNGFEYALSQVRYMASYGAEFQHESTSFSTALGEPWLEHDERYRRSEEFIRYLRGAWTQDHFAFRGDFYRANGYNLKPK